MALAHAVLLAWTTTCSAPIPATMVDTVNSASAYPGQIFRWKITVAARIDNVLVPQDTIGYGVVREVTAASNHNRNGSLVLEMREIYYDHQMLQVMVDPRETAIWAPATTLTERATRYIPVPGIVRTAVNEFRDGRNVTIGPGLHFHVLSLPDPRTGSPCHKVGS